MNQLAKVLNDNHIVPTKTGKILLDEAGKVVTTIGDFEIITEPKSAAPHKVAGSVLVTAKYEGRQKVATFMNGKWS